MKSEKHEPEGEHDIVKRAIHQIVNLLVAQNYEGVRSLTNGIRLSAEQMHEAITEYGCTLMFPPESAFDLMSFGEVKKPKNPTVRQWWIVMPLWTKEEGCSDLSIELTVFESDPITIELDNIHVL